MSWKRVLVVRWRDFNMMMTFCGHRFVGQAAGGANICRSRDGDHTFAIRSAGCTSWCLFRIGCSWWRGTCKIWCCSLAWVTCGGIYKIGRKSVISDGTQICAISCCRRWQVVRMVVSRSLSNGWEAGSVLVMASWVASLVYLSVFREDTWTRWNKLPDCCIFIRVGTIYRWRVYQE